MNDLTLHAVVLRIIAFAAVIAIHGVAVAGAAVALGDRGVRHDGRLTASPLVHLDLVGLVAAIFGMMGWIKPVAVDPAQLRGGRAGLVTVVLAGSLALVVAAIVALALRPALVNLLGDSAATNAFALVQVFAEMSFACALFNLLPIPPLTGAHLLVAAAPSVRAKLPRIGDTMGYLLLAVAAAGMAQKWIGPAVVALARIIYGEAGF